MTQTQQRTPELVTDLERAWLDLLRRALAVSVNGDLTFEMVEVRSGRVWANKALDTIHCNVSAHSVRR